MERGKKSRLYSMLAQVQQWTNETAPIRGHRLDAYFSGEGKLVLANTDLFKFGMMAVDRSLATALNGDSLASKTWMSRAFTRMIFAEMTDLHHLKNTDGLILNNLDGVAHLLLGAIAAGKPGLVRFFYDVILAAIGEAYGVHDGHNPPPGTTLRYAAFALSIISDWLGTPIDLDAHALPRDPAWGQLVAHWREPDPEALLPALLLACDTHVERIAVTEREANALSRDFEFASVFLAVYPTEILAVLRLRDLLGLPNPATIDHPLMQTPYAAITARPGEIADRDELLERYLATVRQRDPQALPSAMADVGNL